MKQRGELKSSGEDLRRIPADRLGVRLNRNLARAVDGQIQSQFYLKANNLLNEKARKHPSFIKVKFSPDPNYSHLLRWFSHASNHVFFIASAIGSN